MPGRACAPGKAGSWGAPGTEGAHKALGSPWFVRPSSRTWVAERGHGSTDVQLSPAHMRWMRWLLPCIGPLLAAASAGPQLSWASDRPAQTSPGREGTRSGEQPEGVCATPFTCGKMGSQPL